MPAQPLAYGSYEELLDATDVDAIYIPIPTGVRKEWVIRAAQAGKHVLCEKPCAVTVADLEEMIDACRRHRVQFMDGVMFMHSRRLERVRRKGYESLANPFGTGVTDISCPIHARDRKVVAALVVPYLSASEDARALTMAQTREQLELAGRRISQSLMLIR